MFMTFAHRLDDVEAKLLETEKEADKARKDSKTARDQFNDIKKKRYVRRWISVVVSSSDHRPDASCSTRRTTTSPSALIKCTRTLRKAKWRPPAV